MFPTVPPAVPAALDLAAFRYRDPAAVDDRSLVYIGRDVPREVLAASGLRPVRLPGQPGGTAAADRYSGADIDAVGRSQLARVLTGQLREAAGLIVSGDCEASVRLFLYLREIQRLEPHAGVPRFTFVDVPHLPHRSSVRYTRARFAELAATLTAWTRTPIDAARLSHAIHEANRTRAIGRALHALRQSARGPLLTGTQFLHLTAFGLTSEPAEFVRLVADVLDGAADLPAAGGTRVFLTGSGHDIDGVYRGIEQRGAVIVGEDTDWGALAWADDVSTDGDPFTALAQAYARGAPASAGFGIVERAEYTASAAAAAGADVAVAWLRQGDDAPPWDIPAQRAALARHGIPLLVVPAQPYAEQPDADVLDRLVTSLADARADVPA